MKIELQGVELPDAFAVVIDGVTFIPAGRQPRPEEAPCPWAWSAASEKKLSTTHPDLQRVMNRALCMSPLDLTVVEGIRTIQRQRKLVASGASKTMNSRHLTGHAVDIAPFTDGAVSWHWPHYHQIAPVIKEAAELEGVPIEWGGDWKFKDGPHWQLPWKDYPV
jgi:peptidoglycan L-alanyl-D-glutamate endopeptidase CwlK